MTVKRRRWSSRLLILLIVLTAIFPRMGWSSVCDFDSDGDGDSDGRDLAVFVRDYISEGVIAELELFAAQYGLTQCNTVAIPSFFDSDGNRKSTAKFQEEMEALGLVIIGWKDTVTDEYPFGSVIDIEPAATTARPGDEFIIVRATMENPYQISSAPFAARAETTVGVHSLITKIHLLYDSAQMFPTYELVQPSSISISAFVTPIDDDTLELTIPLPGEYSLTLTSAKRGNSGSDPVEPIVVTLKFSVIPKSEFLSSVNQLENEVFYPFIEAMKDPLVDDESKKDFLTEAGQKDFARLKKILEDPKVAVGDLVANLEPTEIDSDLYIYTSTSKHFTFLDPVSETETTHENYVQVVFKLVDGQWKIHKLGL